MSEAIIEALRALQSDLHQVELLSQNIANQGTPGYRAVETAARPFDVNSARGLQPQQPVTSLSATAGPLVRTDNENDIAVTDGGFLQVEGGRDGRVALVRGGTIEFDQEGLPTINGRRLVESGATVSANTPILHLVAQSGAQNLVHESLVRPVTISSTSALELVEPGVYEIAPEFVSDADTRVSVLQGYVEQSNVNSSQVVVQMMELSKHVESVQRAMRAIDEMIGSGINELGRR